MSLRASWDNLSPNAKRAAALGGGLFLVVVVGAGSFVVAPPQFQGPQSQSPRDTLVRNILTDADPRALGMDALVNRLERMETRMSELRQQMEKDARNAPPASVQTDAGREQALDRSVEVESLRQEVANCATPWPPSPQPSRCPRRRSGIWPLPRRHSRPRRRRPVDTDRRPWRSCSPPPPHPPRDRHARRMRLRRKGVPRRTAPCRSAPSWRRSNPSRTPQTPP